MSDPERNNPELMATERLKNIKLTGDFDVDALANLKEMLSRNLFSDPLYSIKKLEIYDSGDLEKIPRFPSILLSYKGSDIAQRTIGKLRATFLKRVFIDLNFYFADVNEKNKEYEISKNMSRIISVISRNRDLNGYCRMGVEIGRSTMKDFIKGENVISGFTVPITIPIIYRDRAAGPG